MRMYEEPDYAKSRLRDTIVRFGNTPIIISSIGAREVQYMDMLTDAMGICKLKDLDINPVPLGYLNSNANGAIYMTRTPMREDWRQGLRATSMRSLPERYDPSFRELGKLIVGQYPSLKEALFDTHPKGTAFSRSFAVFKGGEQLFYKGKFNIGSIGGRHNINLLPNFEWVRDELEEELAAA